MWLEKEIKRLKDEPKAARALAQALLANERSTWTDWELDFLEDMAARANTEAHSTRQLEKLLELRDASRHHSRVDGLSVRSLIDECWLGRIDLAEDDEAFISSLKAESPDALKLRPLKRLLYCSRQLGIIDHYVAV